MEEGVTSIPDSLDDSEISGKINESGMKAENKKLNSYEREYP